ncbi:charged multivesicular body protein 7-like [Epargyreus clarus]|uniref:charged multivesicular body protein 7-like n=1 Tax=Epargyreus clarus TaxID=520877 RepID=UPI003C2D6E01
MVLSDTFPEDKLPPCWSDDVRMNALFAPFRLKSANPESWEMKMKFWSDMVRQWCRHKMDPIVSASDIKCVFQRRGRTAACIDIVIEEMFRKGDLAPVLKYQQILHSGPEGWVRWGARLAFKPAVVALTAVSYFLPMRQSLDNGGLPKANIDSTQRFVVESAVKEQATDFVDKYPVGAERIGTIEELMRITDWVKGRETFEILLGYLVSQGIAVKKGDVVKIAEANRLATPVTAAEAAAAQLMTSETRLTRDAARLTRELRAADTEARAAVAVGNKLAAKNHLRRKHIAQQKLSRCEAALDNVRQLLLSTREAESNAAVVDTYRTSAQALKKTMKEGGMEEDAVHDTMDDLKEVMDSYNEVQKVLGGAIDDTDIADLEEELRELMMGPGAPGGGTPGKEERERGGLSLPSPPKEAPSRRAALGEFVFDGEKQMLAELDHLDELDERGSGEGRRVVRGAVAVAANPQEVKTQPKEGDSEEARGDMGWDGTPAAGYGELRTDQRIHPGQPLNVDFSTSPQHYTTDFQVRDHTAASGVWLYSATDGLATSTAYTSSESPGKTGGSFQMAPGGERKPQDKWTDAHGSE